MKKILGKEMLACIISILGVSTGISTMHFEQTAMDIVNMSELISDETMICEDNNMRGNTNLLKNPSFENDSDNDNIPQITGMYFHHHHQRYILMGFNGVSHRCT